MSVSRRTVLTGLAVTGGVAAAGGLVAFRLRDAAEGGPVSTPAPTVGPAATPGGGTPVAVMSSPTPAMAVVAGPANGYVAVAPRVLRAGQRETVSLALFRGDLPARDSVAVALLKDGRPVADASGEIGGRGTLSLDLPRLDEGEYQLRVSAAAFQEQTAVRVEDGTLIFLETDKPIYKPGQTVHIRVMGLAPSLRPVSGQAVVEVMDAKGIKVFKKNAPIDDFGMVAVDLPLSTEPNLGVWKVRASAGRRSSQRDIRVERYVLPKYEVRLELAKEWALAEDPIKGTVAAEYSFGKPVVGEVEIVALRYVGTWQEYARVSRPLDGKLAVEIPAVRYAAGAPAAGGLGNIRLDVTVREQATGYEEKTSRLVPIAASPVSLRVIPESVTFKPGLPFSALVMAETPDKKPVDATIQLRLVYLDETMRQVRDETRSVTTQHGAAVARLTPPARAAVLSIQPSAPSATGLPVTVRAGYSPTNTFITIEQLSKGPLTVGDTLRVKVAATREAKNFYYEVVARGTVVFSDYSPTPEIAVPLSPAMAPEARLLVYQVSGANEVAADYLPFRVQGTYPQAVTVGFAKPAATPGEDLNLAIQTEGAARVGLVGVDRAVFILAENRLNLQQVFDELERLYQKPQIELHDPRPVDGGVARPGAPVPPGRDAVLVPPPDAGQPQVIPGAKDTFQNAGLVVLTNRPVPAGKPLAQPASRAVGRAAAEGLPVPAAAAPTAARAAEPAADKAGDSGLAEVERVRQFFPETWLWKTLTTDAAGRAAERVTTPDSITTWMVRAVALSKDKGLGIGEAQLTVFQPFFVQVDLPYSAVRGEEFPVKIAVYNYLTAAQDFQVELEGADWFDLLDVRSKAVSVPANSVGAVSFAIRPTGLGVRPLKVTARGRTAADAIIKELIVEPEGIERELVANLVLSPGATRTVDLAIPPGAIPGSARAFLALTGNVLSQTMEGLEGLLRMPFGCGEQNMILFAPNVFVARYLKETGQNKPEVMAKAERMMLTGYQRELTYRRGDGSFSAFGQSDKEGSLWLTAFVLKTFAQARDLIFIDDAVLTSARDWIRRVQRPDGSFEPVGFLHHKELMGGLNGKTALTGFVATALREAGDEATAGKALRYLEGQVRETNDAYGLALTTYALALAKSTQAQAARAKLMGLARQSDEGLSWGDDGPQPPPRPADAPAARPAPRPLPGRSAAIETTAYAALALLHLGDKLEASQAVRWLASRRNAQGGFGSTQDTVVALQALAAAASSNRSDIDATVRLEAGQWRKEVRFSPENADVLQVIETPAGVDLAVTVAGTGQLMAQAVRRFNVPAADVAARAAFQVDVRYSAAQVEVNDLITITATVRFTPPEPVAAGMVVLDVAVPTGFAPETPTLTALAQRQPKLKRWDVAGRKVIFYIEDMQPDEQVVLPFQARALYPVRAQAVSSQAYAYYRPEWKGEHLAVPVTTAGR